jgi:fatty-acyl-CoA synthase
MPSKRVATISFLDVYRAWAQTPKNQALLARTLEDCARSLRARKSTSRAPKRPPRAPEALRRRSHGQSPSRRRINPFAIGIRRRFLLQDAELARDTQLSIPMSHSLSFERGPDTVALLDETIGENLRRTVERVGAREAVVVRWQQKRLTYRQLWEETTRAAQALLALGVKAGDRVGVWSSNRYEWVVVQFATARIGAILVNINPAYLKDELVYALRQSGVSLLFHAARFKQSDYAPLLAAAGPQCPELRRCIAFDDDWPSFLDLACRVCETELIEREALLRPDDPINIQYTSGTTGFPKGATLSHRNILNNGYLCAHGLGYSEADSVCVPVPFYHCFGMVLGTLACASHGACMVVPAETFGPLAVLDAVQAERCTSLYGVPTMFLAVLEHPKFARFDVSSLRTGIMAGSPCPVELMKQVVSKLHMPEVAIGYGMTETSPLSTLSACDDPLEKRVGTVGRVLAGTEISIRDADNRLVPRGIPGEFCARGYLVMRGYWNDDAATKKAIDVEGWMHSGDLATMDAAGYVHIVGRLKDLIIRGGENIAPREVESALESHPAISDAQVVGVPSLRFGEEVMAWVKFKPGQRATESELLAYCKERMAAFKVPRFWRFVDAFPMTVTGKIQKFKLREMAIEQLQLQKVAAAKTA